jgi:lipopolysaccharide/colanic/teichoic acid biosynthesis glycosyltransferase/GT2 family glycosyltransferase
MDCSQRATPFVTVIIPAYNAAATLPACLSALGDQVLPPDELIVVDDGSTDDTAEIARRYGAQVIQSTRRRGPAAARNLGMTHGHGDVVAFTDADCAPDPWWLLRLTQPLLEDDEVVGVKGAYRSSQRSLTARFVQQEYEYKYHHMARWRQIDFVDTYSAAYRRDVLLANGGFNQAFSVPSVEDQELSFRLARKGCRMRFEPRAIVGHLHDSHPGEYLTRKYGIGYWKAVMLRQLPEKTFSDSHTPPSQRLQIVFMAVAGLSLVCDRWFPDAWLGALVALVLFAASALPFLAQLGRNDPALIAVAPFMLLCRALALGAGIVVGALFPPPSFHGPDCGISAGTLVVKRMFDVIGALAGLVLSLPILAIASVAIRLDSPGPVLFAQDRAGERGKPFRIFKLRTMRDGADALQGRMPADKQPNDPRVTRVGRWLRRWSIDELPQFWNVLRGDMSLVGPRPEELRVVAGYNDWQRQRLLVKPGLTGPMQVGGRAQLALDARVRLELDYMWRYSLWRDLAILAQTIPAIISGYGAY